MGCPLSASPRRVPSPELPPSPAAFPRAPRPRQSYCASLVFSAPWHVPVAGPSLLPVGSSPSWGCPPCGGRRWLRALTQGCAPGSGNRSLQSSALPRAASSFSLCCVQKKETNNILMLRDLLAASLGPEHAPPVFLALLLAVQHELLLGGVKSEISVPEKPNKLSQTPAGAAGTSLFEQRSLGALFGDTPLFWGCGRTPLCGWAAKPVAAPVLRAQSPAPEMPPGHEHLPGLRLCWGKLAPGTGGHLQVLPAAWGSPRSLSPCPCHREQTPPGPAAPVQVGGLREQPGRRRRLLSHQTDPYRGST